MTNPIHPIVHWDPIEMFLSGWRARVSADPQFPFKVPMEELIGVSACMLDDMATRPNFGLNELDFIFSTLVVGSILNFTLMYLLTPTAVASTANAAIFFLPSYIFEPGSYALSSRIATLINKGATFVAVGSNLRYQMLNALEFVLGKVLPPTGFKVLIVRLRCLNNVLSGMSFVLLARMTRSHKVQEKKAEVEERLIVENAMAYSGVDERLSN
ncbi:uncharacterized protein A4U43_C10F12830 [Asparagus officinalis]|uniref:Uncharacterized protein n=1 Tax=Asparagus officinalis TaxID=4686 RepID=A0A5P1E2N9_ASPOF|nr:uncharacterized protein A4U43_C10F12830 [Asparagus officinalis]